jgi:hypothetical protein
MAYKMYRLLLLEGFLKIHNIAVLPNFLVLMHVAYKISWLLLLEGFM